MASGYIELISKIKPKNNGTFAMVDASDVEMPNGKRLSEVEFGGGGGSGGGCDCDQRLNDLLENPVILVAQPLSFAPSPDFYGVYLYESTPQELGLKPVTAGTKYLVQWGDAEFEETAFAGELPDFGSFVAIGNGEPYGLPESDAPFLIAINEVGVAFFAGADTTPTRRVGIKKAEVKVKESYLPEDWVKGYVEEYINEALGGEY